MLHWQEERIFPWETAGCLPYMGLSLADVLSGISSSTAKFPSSMTEPPDHGTFQVVMHWPLSGMVRGGTVAPAWQIWTSARFSAGIMAMRVSQG